MEIATTVQILLFLLITVPIWITFGIVGRVLARNKGRDQAGWALLGVLFPAFLLILLCLPALEPEPEPELPSEPRHFPSGLTHPRGGGGVRAPARVGDVNVNSQLAAIADQLEAMVAG